MPSIVAFTDSNPVVVKWKPNASWYRYDNEDAYISRIFQAQYAQCLRRVPYDLLPCSLRKKLTSLYAGFRKLKCSGEPEGCSRCKSERTTCHYSPKKVMGRPRKRRREEAEDNVHTEGDTGALEGKAVGTADGVIQDWDLTTFSGNEPGLGADDFYFPAHGFERPNRNSFEAGSIPSLSDIQASIIGPSEGPPPGLEHDFLSRDDLDQPFSTFIDNPIQLQTPPNAPDELDSNNCIIENAVVRCSCLSNLYSMLANFQSLPAPSFPYSMGILKSAAALSHEVVVCQCCTQMYNTALQNSMLLGTLLHLLIMEYAKLLKHIDEKSKESEKVAFRFGDPSSPFDSRHTGLPDCPMAITIDITSDEWRTLARKAVAQEVLGNAQGSLGLIGLVQKMKDRQASLHERFSKGQCLVMPAANHQPHAEKPDHSCMQIVYIDNLQKSLKALGL